MPPTSTTATAGPSWRRRWVASELGITYLGQQGARGSALWRKTVMAPPQAPASAEGSEGSPARTTGTPGIGDRPEPDGLDLGPQCQGDPPYQAWMRRHQSWYRAEALCAPYGTGPTPSSTEHYGNMLAAEPAAAGGNFLTPQIHAHYRQRVAQGVGNIEQFRCERNLLSSQPMAFNLFAPLAEDPDLATRCLRALLPGQVTRVHTGRGRAHSHAPERVPR
jgi:hypothetical protein